MGCMYLYYIPDYIRELKSLFTRIFENQKYNRKIRLGFTRKRISERVLT